MKIEEDTKRQIIGGMLIKEKYKFLPDGAVGEIVREAFAELEKLT